MIEVTIKNYLEAKLNSVPVLFEKPKSKPGKCVIIHELDRGKTNQISAITLEFICCAGTYYSARELCGQVRNALDASVSLPSVSSATVGGENGGFNENNNDYEYDLIFNFIHYEED